LREGKRSVLKRVLTHI